MQDFATKTDFDTKLISFNKKLTQAKHLLAENELKNWKHLIWVILFEKVISKKMAHKIIEYFSQCIDIL